MSAIIIYCIGFFIAGFIQEILITSYHRALMTNKVKVACVLSAIIAVVSLLVFTEAIKRIFDPAFGWVSYIFVLVFALGKGVGTYFWLGKLNKWAEKEP